LETLNVICVLWHGEFRARDYTVDDVVRLERMVIHNLNHLPMQFICLTNLDISECPSGLGINWIPLEYDLLGWWSKLEVFRSNLGLKGRCLYLDLDVLICGLIDDIAFYSDGITFMLPISPPKVLPYLTTKTNKEGKVVVTRFQSSCFTWDAPREDFDINELLSSNIVDKYRGDQDVLGLLYNLEANTFPPEWFTKIRDCRKLSAPPPGVKVILGNPKPLWRKFLENVDWVKELANV